MSVYLDWKTIPEDPQNIWIVMTAFGKVDLPETRLKLAKLQDTLDHFEKHYSTTHKFTFVFDFSKCKDFAKIGMLGDIKHFLATNDKLIESHLRKSYILLRDPSWCFWTKLIFAFRKPKQPYTFKMTDRKLYNALRYRQEQD
jgi:hypothetical protein